MGNPKWEQPLISVDVIALQLNKRKRELNLFLGKRKYEPNKGDFALPGVLLLPNERALDAAKRALNEKVNIPDSAIKTIKDIGIADNPDRDPRGPSLSVVILAILDNDFNIENSDTKTVALKDLETTSLPFDHATLVKKTLKSLDSLVMNDKQITQSLLGDTFRTTDLHAVSTELHALTGNLTSIPDLSNLSRSLKSNAWLASSTEAIPSGTKGRPASTWTFFK